MNSANKNGKISGSASQEVQEEFFSTLKSIEGITEELKPDRSLGKLVHDLEWGLRSACTYMDAHNLKELKEHAQFVETGSGSLKNSNLTNSNSVV